MNKKLIRFWSKITGRRHTRLAALRKVRADRRLDRLERTMEAAIEALPAGEERRKFHRELLELRMNRVLARGKRQPRILRTGGQNAAMIEFARHSLLKPA